MKTVSFNHRPGDIPASLSQLSMFAKLKRSCLDDLLHHAELLQAGPGDKVVREGGRTGALYFLLKGTLEVVRGERVLAYLKKPGELFGEMAYISNEPHGATVRAAGEALILKIDTNLSYALSAEHLDHFESVLYRHLAKLLAARLREATGGGASASEPSVYRL